MTNINQLIIEGTCCSDAELKEVPCGKIATCNISVTRHFKDFSGDVVDEIYYFDIESYGNLAEIAGRNCKRGRVIRVVGRLKQERWKNSDGIQWSKLKIVAEHIEFKPIHNKEEK